LLARYFPPFLKIGITFACRQSVVPEIKVTILGTEKLIKNLDPTKATGPDQILARILKQIAAEFAPHLTTIFNTSITKGEVPPC
jgi:hypothetical protein